MNHIEQLNIGCDIGSADKINNDYRKLYLSPIANISVFVYKEYDLHRVETQGDQTEQHPKGDFYGLRDGLSFPDGAIDVQHDHPPEDP